MRIGSVSEGSWVWEVLAGYQNLCLHVSYMHLSAYATIVAVTVPLLLVLALVTFLWLHRPSNQLLVQPVVDDVAGIFTGSQLSACRCSKHNRTRDMRPTAFQAAVVCCSVAAAQPLKLLGASMVLLHCMSVALR